MAKMIKKFNNDLKLPSKAAVQKAATPVKQVSAPKQAVAKKPATKASAAMVTLLLPQGSTMRPHKTAAGVNWAVTPHLEGHKFPHWFRDDKFPIAQTDKGITVQVPRSVAASKGMVDYIQA